MPTLAAMVEESARLRPGAVAVEGAEHALTYEELLVRAREIAAGITAADARCVAVTGERGPALVAAVLATVLADVRLVLIDPELPAARRAAMTAAAGAVLRLTATAGGRVTAEPLAPEERSDENAGEDSAAPSPGYVFFTSGTTSTPKAVLGRWSGVAHFVGWQRDIFGIVEGDRFAQLTGLSFDVVLRDLFTPLVSGATVCVPPAGAATGRDGIVGWLRGARISVVHTVPSLAARWTSTASAAPGGALRLTFFAGEPLPGAAVTGWLEHFADTRVLNLYGPSETTLAKFWHDVTVPAPGVQPVGAPLPETEFRLVDGEVWIGTPHATDGYLGAPDEQRARFVTAAAAEDEAPRAWYRTGDLGELDEDGALHLRGRSDFQVKIDGNRVEPEGIAALLREHPAVRNAVVVARPREDGSVRLVGYYEAAAEDAPEDEIRRWSGTRLPAAHVPSVLRRLDRLPLSANGKVERAALPDPFAAGPGDGADGGPEDGRAADPFTRTVVDVFRHVLPDAPDRSDSDFFDWGGTSLDSAELAVRLLSATGRRIEMSEIYALRTPAAIAGVLRDREPDTQDGIPHGERPATTGLSPQQRRYRNVYLPRVNRSWSNMPALFALPDGVDAEAVESALRTVLTRHDSLRAYFTEESGGSPDDAGLRQHFLAVEDVRVEVETDDLRGLPEDEQDVRMQELRIAGANTPIDITRAPLFRTRLLRHHTGRSTLLWTVHHMVSDGYSQRLLHQELTHLLAGEPERLPHLPIGYRDYIAWRAAPGSAERTAEAHRPYWQGVFGRPYERPLLPLLEGAAEPARGIAHQFPVPDELRSEVAAFCRTHGTTPFSVYFAAYTLMCHDLFGREDLVIGTPAAGRTRPEFQELIGNFISLVGIRHRLGETGDFAALVAALQERTVLAMEHQDYQYDQLMADIGAVTDDDRFPLTTVFLSLVEVPADQAATLRAPAHRDLGCEVKFDLMGYLKRAGDMIALEFDTRQGLLSPERLEELAGVFLAHLRSGLKEG
ncbi:condensation domain-containing protein [Streptomyces sp. NBC_00102]|uniref:condensation domain-containing protein n=1 Tax=Streptomyces sp. NBC_00102 TaxID=2975652 RepID=UPI002259D8F9|nr:condensation domain-containing protein [Streptomyces sp. NBC_00102]MCX5399492.1 AMP-binding protein [Streptomyces sp. NBC_00102]